MGKVITDINELDLNGTYTVADYEAWQFDELVQLIKGENIACAENGACSFIG